MEGKTEDIIEGLKALLEECDATVSPKVEEYLISITIPLNEDQAASMSSKSETIKSINAVIFAELKTLKRLFIESKVEQGIVNGLDTQWGSFLIQSFPEETLAAFDKMQMKAQAKMKEQAQMKEQKNKKNREKAK